MIRAPRCDLDGTLVAAWTATPLPDVAARWRARRDPGVPVVVMTHEALFSAGSPLAGWIDQQRDDPRLPHQINRRSPR